MSEQGFSTMEVLVALAVLVLTLSAVISVVFGNQSLLVDSVTNYEALLLSGSTEAVNIVRAHANFYAAPPTVTNPYYSVSTTQSFISRCVKDSAVRNSWPVRNQFITLALELSNPTEAIALGRDCGARVPDGNWVNPVHKACAVLASGKVLDVDVLDNKAYIASDSPPFLHILDLESAPAGQSCGTDNFPFIAFANGFDAAVAINDVDVIKTSSGRRYAFVARHHTEEQLGIIDVTDANNPVLVTTVHLDKVNKDGSFPQGYKVVYYDGRLYVTTRETDGPELHVFDVSDLETPVELGSFSFLPIGLTVTDMVVANMNISGSSYVLAFLATRASGRELITLNVTNPTNIVELQGARVDLPGDQDGQAVALLGNRLFLGRQSVGSGGAELFVFDASDPFSAVAGLPALGQVDVGTGIERIVASGNFAFLATQRTTEEFQVWDTKSPSSMGKVSMCAGNSSGCNLSSDALGGVDLFGNWVLVGSHTAPQIQLIYSP